MLRFLKFLIVAPFAIVFLIFAFANRHTVTVSFDPFASGDVPAFAIQAPLFAALILCIAIGVVAGSATTWFGQGKHRRAARARRAEAERLRADLLAARAGIAPSPIPISKRA